jgi:hypothetical protein
VLAVLGFAGLYAIAAGVSAAGALALLVDARRALSQP